jgi:hypothetical protein
MTNVTGLPLSTGVTGTLAVANGGTGVGTLTGYVYGNGTSAFTAATTIPGSAITGTVTANLVGNVTGNVTGTATTATTANGLNTGNSYSAVNFTGSSGGSPSYGAISLSLVGNGAYGGGVGLIDGSSCWGIFDEAGTLIFGGTTSGSSAPLGIQAALDQSGNFTASGNVIANGGTLYVGTTTNFGGGNLNLRNSATTSGKAWNTGPNASNAYLVYNQSGTGVYCGDGSTSWTANSDERVKDIIEPITDAANKVASLRTVIGRYKTDDQTVRRSFLIAQDVQAVLPEAVDTQNDELKTLGVRYTDLIPLLAAAINEIKAEFDAYKATHP